MFPGFVPRDCLHSSFFFWHTMCTHTVAGTFGFLKTQKRPSRAQPRIWGTREVRQATRVPHIYTRDARRAADVPHSAQRSIANTRLAFLVHSAPSHAARFNPHLRDAGDLAVEGERTAGTQRWLGPTSCSLSGRQAVDSSLLRLFRADLYATQFPWPHGLYLRRKANASCPT